MRGVVRLLTLGAAAALLQGCITTALFVANRPSQSVLNEMERWCRKDSGVRWFGERPSDVDLWLVGELESAPRTGETLQGVKPLNSYWNADEWIRRGFARKVFVNVEPILSATGVFGPKLGDPIGIYEVTVAPISHPSCAPYEAHMARLERGLPPERRYKTDRCPVIRYVGPFDGRPRPEMVVLFNDAAAKAHGFSRLGRVMFVGGSVRATETRYAAISPNGSTEHAGAWGAKSCAPFMRQLEDGPA